MTATRMLRWPAWCCVGLLAALSLLPAEEMARTGMDGRLEHAFAYTGTAFLFRISYPEWGWKRPASGLVVYAAVLEVLQTFSPGRHPAVEDWLAGSVGVLIGIGAAICAVRLCALEHR